MTVRSRVLAAPVILVALQGCLTSQPQYDPYNPGDVSYLTAVMGTTGAQASVTPSVTNPNARWLIEAAINSAPIAVQSELCGYWDTGYWQARIITAEVRTDITGAIDQFRSAALKEIERFENSSDQLPCGSALRELAMMDLTNWAMVRR